jgi:hypothetical protein
LWNFALKTILFSEILIYFHNLTVSTWKLKLCFVFCFWFFSKLKQFYALSFLKICYLIKIFFFFWKFLHFFDFIQKLGVNLKNNSENCLKEINCCTFGEMYHEQKKDQNKLIIYFLFESKKDKFRSILWVSDIYDEFWQLWAKKSY